MTRDGSIPALADEVIEMVSATDSADTPAVLRAAWHGLGLAQATGTVLSSAGTAHDADTAAAAAQSLEKGRQIVRSAPSFPGNGSAEATPPARGLGGAGTGEIRHRISIMMLALNIGLSLARDHAIDDRDAVSCSESAALCQDLADLYASRPSA